MHERKPVHEYRHIVAVRTSTFVGGVLVDDLQRIVVDVLLSDQVDVFGRTVVTD